MQDRAAERTDGGVERRTALRWLIRGFLSLWGLGAAALGLSFLKSPEREKRPGEGLVHCGSFSSLGVGETRFIRHGAEPLFVVRATATQVIALSAVCTHMRCVLRSDPETRMLRCPCHAGSFDRSGNVLTGPAARPLDRFPAEIRGDEILVKT